MYSGNIRSATTGRTPALGGSSAKKVGPPPPPKPKNHLNVRKGIFQTPTVDGQGQGVNGTGAQDPVEVFCRIRPLKNMIDSVCVKQVKENVIELTAPVGAKASHPTAFYSFKKVFDQTTQQKNVFEDVCLPMVKDSLEGKNGLLFTYGVTGSGKTHTVTGEPDNPGILPRTLDALFNTIQENQARKFAFKPDGQNSFSIQSPADAVYEKQMEDRTPKIPSVTTTPGRSVRQRTQEANQLKMTFKWAERTKDSFSVDLKHKTNKFAIFVSYIEVYNNYIYDLLDDNVIDQLKKQHQRNPQSKVLREDANKRMFVVGCCEEEVTSSTEAIEVFLKGMMRRKIAETVLNSESSRSHSVFSIRVVQAPMDDEGEVSVNSNRVTVAQLSLVDLAGSERTGRTGAKGERLREAGNINNSLMSLRNCLDILRENQKLGVNKVVPYRESKITHLFKAYFEGEGKVKMVICISPSSDEHDETLHVLKFAETTQEVMVTRQKDIVFPASIFRSGLKRDIQLASMGNFGPNPPSILFGSNEGADDERVIPEWLHWVEDHKKVREEKTAELYERQSLFREQLSRVEEENILLKNVNTHLKNDLSAREDQVKKLEAEVTRKERERDSNSRKTVTLETHIQTLEKDLFEAQERIAVLEEEKSQAKKNHEQALRLEQSRIRDTYEARMQDALSQLKRESCLNQEKMSLVRQILSGNSEEVRAYHDTLSTTSQATTRKTRSHGRAMSQDRAKIHQRASAPGPVDSQVIGMSVQPMMNPRHMRSSSIGEKWLDHRPPGTLELGTVLQPSFRRRRSVTSVKDLTAQDIKKSSNYALTSHTTGETGEVETRVFKGEVIPSFTGGAHVIFNDVERLTQEDPTSPTKNKSSGNRKRTGTASTTDAPSTPSTTSTVNVTKRSRR